MAALGAMTVAALPGARRASLRGCACWAGALVALLAGGSGDALAARVSSSLVNEISTSHWSPASPDPSGIAYDSRAHRLIVVDGEVEEMSIFRNANYYEATLSGELVRTADTMGFTHEPVGVAVDPGRRTFISDDDLDVVFELPRGPDGRFGSIEPRRSFSTTAFGSNDPEGVSYDRMGNRLFIADGSGSEIYELSPVDGVFGNGNDRVRHFDTKALGVGDPETVEFNPASGTLYVIGVSGDKIVEVTAAGAGVSEIDTSYLPLAKPAGLAYAPSSRNATLKSFYIADRKVDNDGYPDENDGTIYEVTTGPSVAPRSGHYLPKALDKGVVVRARCSTACVVTARLYLRRALAREPKISHSKPVALAEGRARLSRAGNKRFRIKFGPRPKRRLRRAQKLRFSLHATLTAAGGKAKTREKTVLVLRRR
jgi:DNA-binding beta-propeller fold protein YncE